MQYEQCPYCGDVTRPGEYCSCARNPMLDDDEESPTPDPWTCDECGHVNSPDSPVCPCEFWDREARRVSWENAIPCPQCGTPILYQDEIERGLCPMCWNKQRKEQ